MPTYALQQAAPLSQGLFPNDAQMMLVGFDWQRQVALKDVMKWTEFAEYLQSADMGMDSAAARRTARQWAHELATIAALPSTRAEYDRIMHTLPDSWKLRQYALNS